MKPAPAKLELTVLIPTYNRSSVLRQCLDALARQTLSSNKYEVIVGDDGSSDNTSAIVSEMHRSCPMRISYFRLENSGPGAARNRGLALAGAPLALIINDDTIATPQLLAEHLAAHSEHPSEHVAVLGRITIAPELPHSIFAPLHLDAAFASFSGQTELDWRAFITSNVSVKRSFLLKHGLFEVGMFPHEDLELGERLSHHGLRIIYRPDALAYHFHYLTEADYFRAAERDGRALAHWYKKAPHLEPLLTSVGLYGSPPLKKAFRHRLADAVLAGSGKRIALKTARVLARLSDAAARVVYKKLYQYEKRGAIDSELRGRN